MTKYSGGGYDNQYMKKCLYLFLILFVFISVLPNNLFASEYSGKKNYIKSKDVRIKVTDVDTSIISGLRTNEGILDIDIKHLKSGKKRMLGYTLYAQIIIIKM